MGIGKELKRLREEVPISVDKIAKQIGVKPERWRKWEELDQKPRTDDTLIIEKFFGKDLAEIIELKSIKQFINVPHGTNWNSGRNSDLNIPLPIGDLVVTLGDYFELLKSQRDSYERIIESGLVKIQNDVTQSNVDNHGRASAILDEIRSWNTVILKAVKGQPRAVPPKQSNKNSEKPSQKRQRPGTHKDGHM